MTKVSDSFVRVRASKMLIFDNCVKMWPNSTTRKFIFFEVYTGFLLRSRVSVLMMVVGRSDSEDLRLRSRPKPRVKEQNGDNKEQTNQGGTQGVDDK